jgi:hypothetical protein
VNGAPRWFVLLIGGPSGIGKGGAYPFILFQEVNEGVGPIFQKIAGGQLGVRDGLAEAEREANRLLAQTPR